MRLELKLHDMTIYVVTRCEEHSDYVEFAYKDRSDAERYCQKFNNDENEYWRCITETELK